MKKTTFFTIIASLLFSTSIFAQVGVGTTTPNGALDVNSATDGMLIPRVALTATNAVAPLTAPTNSELVYNTATAGVAPNNVTPGFYYSGYREFKMDQNLNRRQQRLDHHR